MARRKRKSLSAGWLVVVAVLAVVVAAIATYFITGGGKGSGDEPGTHRTKPTATVTEEHNERTVTVYVANITKDGMTLSPVRKKTDVAGDILDVAVEMQLAADDKLIPHGTELLSPVELTGNVATINLSKEFVDNFPGGSTQEALTLNSIARAVVDNSGGKVNKIRILVEGEAVETLGGHFSLQQPFDVKATTVTPDNKD
jgi:spore germination protein GerM